MSPVHTPCKAPPARKTRKQPEFSLRSRLVLNESQPSASAQHAFGGGLGTHRRVQRAEGGEVSAGGGGTQLEALEAMRRRVHVGEEEQEQCSEEERECWLMRIKVRGIRGWHGVAENGP